MRRNHLSADYIPLGRTIRYVADEQGKLDMEKSKVIYFHSGCFCGSRTGHQTVREWLKEFHFLESESFLIQWSQVLMETNQFLRRLEKMITDQDIMNMARSMVCALLFTQYGTGKEFHPQFDSNVEELRKHIAAIESMV